MSLREWVRRNVPFSTTVYEQAEHRMRRRSSRSALASLEDSGAPLWLDLGGGARAGRDGWLNIDITRQCDIYWDLREGIPFPDGRVARLYSSHVLEHLTFRDGQALMREGLRVLQPGGSFSVCVPDAGMYIRAYAEGRQLPEDFFGWTPAVNGSTAIDMVNYTAYMDGHHAYMFDQENLVRRLELAGFERVTPREFDPTIDRPERDFESIYAIAHKPAG